MKRLLLLAIIALCFWMGTSESANAVAPKVFHYQANLLAADNSPLTGVYAINFELFDVPNGGVPVWTSNQSVTIVNGYLNVYLGDVTPLTGVSFDKALWLQVTVGNAAPYARTPLTSTPYAMFAVDADTALVAKDVVDKSITLSKLGLDVLTAGGDLTGLYPNPTIKAGAIVKNIGKGEITQFHLAPNVTVPPSGKASGDLAGTYPDPIIAAGAVKTDRIADGAVTAAKLAPGAITTINIADGTITQNKLAPGIQALPMGPAGGDLTGTYPNPTIALNAVTTDKVLNAAITNAKIADFAVTVNKIGSPYGSLVQPLGSVIMADGLGGSFWSTNKITLPFSESTTSAITAFEIFNNGTGAAGHFANGNLNSTSPALFATSASKDPSALAFLAERDANLGGYVAAIKDNGNDFAGRGLYVENSANYPQGWMVGSLDPTDVVEAGLVVRNTAGGDRLAIKTYGDIMANSSIYATNIIGIAKVVVGDVNGLNVTLTPPAFAGAPLEFSGDIKVNGNEEVTGDLTVGGNFYGANGNFTNINVSGVTTTNDLQATTGNIATLDAAIANLGTVTTTGDVTVGGSLSVAGVISNDGIVADGSGVNVLVNLNGTTATFTGAVKGISPVAANDFTTKGYVDAANALLSGQIATNTAAIATLNTTVAGHTTQIATNTANIATNTTAIATLNTTVATHTTQIATNTTAIATLNTTVTANTAQIATNTANIATLTTGLANEITARIAGDATTLASANTYTDAQVAAEALARFNADALEVTARTNADNALQANINTVQANVTAEAATRLANDNTLQANITAEAATRAAADVVLQTNITNEVNARVAAAALLQANIDAATLAATTANNLVINAPFLTYAADANLVNERVLAGTANQITFTPATAVIGLADFGTAGVYGDQATVPVITVDAKGRISGTVNTPILITDVNVDANAAIAGTKISPDFGTQNIVTLGTVTADDATFDDVTVDELNALETITVLGNPVAVMAAPLTAGSITFADAAGLITEDNANLFWDTTNKMLGIGTNAPTNTLEVNGNTLLTNSINANTTLTVENADPGFADYILNVTNGLPSSQASAALFSTDNALGAFTVLINQDGLGDGLYAIANNAAGAAIHAENQGGGYALRIPDEGGAVKFSYVDGGNATVPQNITVYRYTGINQPITLPTVTVADNGRFLYFYNQGPDLGAANLLGGALLNGQTRMFLVIGNAWVVIN